MVIFQSFPRMLWGVKVNLTLADLNPDSKANKPESSITSQPKRTVKKVKTNCSGKIDKHINRFSLKRNTKLWRNTSEE